MKMKKITNRRLTPAQKVWSIPELRRLILNELSTINRRRLITRLRKLLNFQALVMDKTQEVHALVHDVVIQHAPTQPLEHFYVETPGSFCRFCYRCFRSEPQLEYVDLTDLCPECFGNLEGRDESSDSDA